MSTSDAAIERSLALLAELVREDRALEAELRDSRRAFQGPLVPAVPPGTAPAAEQRAADRRHLEWFLLERPSEALGGVPAHVLAPDWIERVGPVEPETLEALLGSLAGVFEVTGVEPGRGIWLRDLFGLGEYPIHEPEAAGELSAGDLLVGRLFPVGDGLFRLSPVATCFRNRVLAEALHGDVERLRASRRGSLRIAQDELEHLFFRPGGPAGAAGRADAARRARAELSEAGLERAEIENVLAEVARAAEPAGSGGAVVTEVLNRLAFDTAVDLERARVALAGLWSSLREEPRSTEVGEAAVPEPAERVPGSSAGDVRAALERFDQGRREGRDLEALFGQLEADLGLETNLVDDDDFAPDFPGVVGAMVEEYLWDLARVEGVDAAGRAGVLRQLAEYGAGIGVFEELGARELVDFAARWMLDRGRLRDEAAVTRLVQALGAFARWVEEQHAHPLWTDFEASHARLATDLARHAALRAELAAAPVRAARAFRVTGLEGPGRVRLAALEDEDPQEVALDPALAARLRAGDLVRGAVQRDGSFALEAAYPGVLERFLGAED